MKRIWAFLLSVFFCLSLLAEGKRMTLHDGAQIYYDEYGEGEVVLLLHGHTLDGRMWKEQIKVLKDSFRVIVPDFRGYGLSSDPIEGVEFTYADDIVEMMDSLKIDKAHVVGLSMGAYIAGDMVAMCPQRLHTCMMVAGEICNRPGPSQPKTREERERQRLNNKKSFQNAGSWEAYKKNRVEQLIKRAGSHGEEMREELTRMIMEWGAWQSQHVTARVYYGLEAWAKLKETKPTVPSLIIYGEKEGAGRSRMLDYLPNSSQIKFSDCGHMVNMEQKDLFNKVLLEWLTLHPENIKKSY